MRSFSLFRRFVYFGNHKLDIENRPLNEVENEWHESIPSELSKRGIPNYQKSPIRGRMDHFAMLILNIVPFHSNQMRSKGGDWLRADIEY